MRDQSGALIGEAGSPGWIRGLRKIGKISRVQGPQRRHKGESSPAPIGVDKRLCPVELLRIAAVRVWTRFLGF